MGSRSVWKGPFFDCKILEKVEENVKNGKSSPIRIWSRRSTILPEFVGHNFLVHNGKKFIPVLVSEKMIGKKFGEFSPTRTFTGHSGNKKGKTSRS